MPSILGPCKLSLGDPQMAEREVRFFLCADRSISYCQLWNSFMREGNKLKALRLSYQELESPFPLKLRMLTKNTQQPETSEWTVKHVASELLHPWLRRYQRIGKSFYLSKSRVPVIMGYHENNQPLSFWILVSFHKMKPIPGTIISPRTCD